MSESLPHILDREQRPRSLITYDVELGGATKKIELPFVVGVLADLTGQPVQALAPLFGPAVQDSTIGAPLPAQPPADLDDLQLKIWDFLNETRNVDDIARRVELSVGTLSGLLMNLELKRVIRRLPGNLYERF